MKTYLLTRFGEHYLRYSTVIAEENLVKGPKQRLIGSSPLIIIISTHGTQK
jgi:hypothetical protein